MDAAGWTGVEVPQPAARSLPGPYDSKSIQYFRAAYLSAVTPSRGGGGAIAAAIRSAGVAQMHGDARLRKARAERRAHGGQDVARVLGLEGLELDDEEDALDHRAVTPSA